MTAVKKPPKWENRVKCVFVDLSGLCLKENGSFEKIAMSGDGIVEPPPLVKSSDGTEIKKPFYFSLT